MDISTRTIISDGVSVESVDQQIFDMWIDMTSDQKSKQEAMGLDDYKYVLWQIEVVM